MGGLGDLFPPEWRAERASQQLQPGAVLRTMVENTKPPKIKRWIVVAATADALLLGLVYINSEINPNIFPERDRHLHVPMQPDERGLVDKPCYADCSTLQHMPLAKARALLTADAGCLLGHLHGYELGQMQQTVAGSRRLSVVEKKRFGLSLRA